MKLLGLSCKGNQGSLTLLHFATSLTLIFPDGQTVVTFTPSSSHQPRLSVLPHSGWRHGCNADLPQIACRMLSLRRVSLATRYVPAHQVAMRTERQKHPPSRKSHTPLAGTASTKEVKPRTHYETRLASGKLVISLRVANKQRGLCLWLSFSGSPKPLLLI